MPGLNDSTLVHGVLDLINSRLKSTAKKEQVNEWEGTPSVFLLREHPLDEWVLTGVNLVYPSGSQSHIKLIRGMTDDEINKAIAKNKDAAFTPYVDLTTPITGDEYLPDFNLLSAEEQISGAVATPVIEPGSYGSYSIEPTIPVEVDGPDHYDYEYYKEWRLKRAIIDTYDSQSQPIERLIIHMVYDTQSRLVSALAEIDLEWLN